MNLTQINSTDVSVAAQSLRTPPLPKLRNRDSAVALATKKAGVPFCAVARHGRLSVILVLGMAAGFLAARPGTGSAPQTNDVAQIISDVLQTNGLVQAEEMLPANDVGQPDESAPGNEAVPSNGSTDASGNGTSASGQSEGRRSGRESRSRRFNSQRSAQSSRTGGTGDSTFGSSSQMGTNTGPVSLDYSAFKVVADRNIFDPNRHPRGSNYRASTKEPEYFTLVGVMSYEKGTFAFFSGTSSAYQKALKAADSIAGYKLAAIAPNSVKLARETNEVELNVGMQMRLDDDGTWQPASGSASYAAQNSTIPFQCQHNFPVRPRVQRRGK